jgi:hypothetical protein
MGNRKNLVLCLLLIMVIAMIGCSSGGSSSGGSSSSSTSTTTSTATASMVGTWKCDKAGSVPIGSTIVFYADKTGTLNNGATGINNWVYTSSGLTGNKLTFNLNSGQPESFRVDWDNTNYNSFTFTNLNPATPDANHYAK